MGTEEALWSATPDRIPEGRPCLIVRPRDGGGRVGQELPEVVRYLREHALRPVVVEARRPGEGGARAREALGAGGRFLVSVGGDGLAREVVAAIMESSLASEVTLSVLSAGSDCDFVKTFGLPPDAATAVPRLLTGSEYPIDVIRLTSAAPGGGTTTTHFAGLAEVGLWGIATRRAERLPAPLGRIRSFAAFWWTMGTFRIPQLTVTADGRSYEGRAHEVIVANTQRARGGIRISPRSFPGDGIVDVLVMRGPRSDHYTLLPKMFMGEQLPNPNIVELRAHERVEVDGSRPLWIQADTTPIGLTPAVFEVLPEALRLKV